MERGLALPRGNWSVLAQRVNWEVSGACSGQEWLDYILTEAYLRLQPAFKKPGPEADHLRQRASN